MNIINKIREEQNQLIVMINTTFDKLVREVEALSANGGETEIQFEAIYPIENTAVFKGKKPIAVKFGDNRIITPTWKTVVEVILKEVLKDEKMQERALNLSDKLLGRIRKRVSKDSEGMRSPLEICEGLYIETHYDTETLMKLLLQILDGILFDYSDITIAIKNN